MGTEKDELKPSQPPSGDDQGLAEVLAEEMPEALELPEASHLDPESPELEDRLPEVLAGEEDPELGPEEAALHVTKRPPGAVDRDIDSYTGEPIP
jgi:hypothetical protein